MTRLWRCNSAQLIEPTQTNCLLYLGTQTVSLRARYYQRESLDDLKIDPLCRRVSLLSGEFVRNNNLQNVCARRCLRAQLNQPACPQSLQVWFWPHIVGHNLSFIS